MDKRGNMKFKYSAVFIVSIFCLISAGCVSNYSISDYSSEEQFYQRINYWAKNKSVNVALKNDSLISSSEGIEIKNDSLYFISRKTEKKNEVISLSSIADVNYSSIDYNSAHILLKNNQEFQAENIIIIPDSMRFQSVKIVVIQNPIAVAEVKEISYKNRWEGVPTGFLGGAVAGGLIGLSVYEGNGALIGAVSGAFIGGIIGWIIGINNNYKFPQEN
jgi:outer membrane lipoprotein SlyB